MKIKYFSDLHLDCSNTNIKVDDNIDVCVLAGDIAVDINLLKNLIAYQIDPNVKIIFTPGNHEFEGKQFDDVLKQLKNLEKEFPNFFMLYNESKVIGGYKFIGSTLWSNFEGAGINYAPEVEKWAKNNIIDFNSILCRENEKYKYQFLTPYLMKQKFNQCYNFIKYELREPFDGEKVVVTHFAPHNLSIHPKYGHNIINAYWVNHLPELMGFSKYWIHGHTHLSFEYNVQGTTVLCNPRGYSNTYDLSENCHFDHGGEIGLHEENIINIKKSLNIKL